MIGKVCRRGTDTRRLLGYLFLEGAAGERGLDSAHRDAHLIAGYADPRLLEPARAAGGRAEVSRLAALLDAPVRAGGVGRDSKPVYHLALSAAPTDRVLSDAEWADIAVEYLDRLGLAPRGDSEAVRWVAVRHADHHVHVVATLVRLDGRRVFPKNDFYRSREASLAVEARYGLTRTSPAERTGGRETTRGELRKHQAAARARVNAGLSAAEGPDREVLRSRVRAALAGADSWPAFAGRLRLSGVLVRERYSTHTPGQLTGYAVALPAAGARATTGEQSIWFGGGKLAPGLSLPQLQARWTPIGTGPGPGPRPADTARPSRAGQPDEALSVLDRRRLWLSAQQALRGADEQIRDASNPTSSADAQAGAQAAAAAAGEVLSALGWLVERKRGGPLREAADSYGRAACDLRRQTVPATAHSLSVRRAAAGLLSAGLVKQCETGQLLALLGQLSALADTLARLRVSQGRAAQAHAGRRTAEQLSAEQARRATAAAAATAATRLGGPVSGLPFPPPRRFASGPAPRPPSASR